MSVDPTRLAGFTVSELRAMVRREFPAQGRGLPKGLGKMVKADVIAALVAAGEAVRTNQPETREQTVARYAAGQERARNNPGLSDRADYDERFPAVDTSAIEDEDAELMSFMRSVVNAPSLPVPLPVTETNVAAAKVTGLVQFGKRLVWAKLISVINRRTSFSPAFLVAVEFEGVRRLIKADHYLAA